MVEEETGREENGFYIYISSIINFPLSFYFLKFQIKQINLVWNL